MMSRVNLADLANGRVPLAPRDAATLTLAVAHEWDRQRELHGPTSLPQLAAIELTATGAVAFLVNTPTDGDSHDAAMLSRLLTQLLGIEDDGPRYPLPGGLLITISGRLGDLDLPSATPEGFRTALARFADDTPHALRSLYWRTVTARSRSGHRVRKAAAPKRQHERRASSAQVNELRRSIRKLEQRIFEESHEPAPSPGGRVPGWLAQHSAVAAAIVLFLASIFTLTGAWFLQSDAVPNATAAPIQAEAATTPADNAGPVLTKVAVTTGTVTASERARRQIATPQRSRQRVDARTVRHVDEPSSRRRAAASAGGTRGIAWLAP